MKRSKKCPNCDWKLPLTYPPGNRKEGAQFDCPSCGTKLIYHTGLEGKSKQITTTVGALTLPMIALMYYLDDNMTLQIMIVIPVIIVALLALVYFFSIEYVERNHSIQ